jgi:DNA polymerase sigma
MLKERIEQVKPIFLDKLCRCTKMANELKVSAVMKLSKNYLEAMIKLVIVEIARKLRDALKEGIDDFEGLYVFGSQVCGDAAEESDMDIVVLFGQHHYPSPKEYAGNVIITIRAYRMIAKLS